MSKLVALRLEQYTIQCQEVLMVEIKTVEGELEIVAIYNGFSSSLTNPTPYNPDIPVIASDSEIVGIDRLVAPYNPNEPQYLARNLSLAEMEQILETMNI